LNQLTLYYTATININKIYRFFHSKRCIPRATQIFNIQIIDLIKTIKTAKLKDLITAEVTFGKKRNKHNMFIIMYSVL